MCGNLNILCHSLSLGLERKLIFSSPVPTAEFSKFAGILSAALSQNLLLGFEICDPITGSPQGSSSWDTPGKNTGVGLPFPSPMHESEK